MDNKEQDFLSALARTVLESEATTFTKDSLLDPWDSLAVVSTIALIDEIYGKSVNGRKLSECQTAGDILTLVEGA